MNWAPSSICDLYKSRWAIEVFFKELKQTLQLSDFLGYNETAVKWQIWSALIVHLLLRFIAFQSQWKGSFTRLFTLLRGILWARLDINALLASYGTARASPRLICHAYQAYLTGLHSV